jgi:putative transposase
MSVQHDGTRYWDVSCWELSDSFWERINRLLPKEKSRYRGRGKARKHIGGRPPADRRKVMAGILYVLRTGCQWNAAPQVLYGSGKTLHRYFQRWRRAGVFKRMWEAGLEEYDEVHGLKLKWQAADGAITKAPLGGEATGANPTDRGKSGTKRSLLVAEKGVPIGIEVAGAQRHDIALLKATLEAKMVELAVDPKNGSKEQHLCLDKGYAGAEKIAEPAGYVTHIPQKANSKQRKRRKGGRRKARRWVVEVTHSWINRFRRLHVRWEKKLCNYLALLHFAFAIICWRKCEVKR